MKRPRWGRITVIWALVVFAWYCIYRGAELEADALREQE